MFGRYVLDRYALTRYGVSGHVKLEHTVEMNGGLDRVRSALVTIHRIYWSSVSA